MVTRQPSFHIRGEGLKHQTCALCNPFCTAAEIAFCRVGLEVVACIHVQATVFRVAHAVAVHIIQAPSAAHTDRVQHVSFTIARALGQTGPIANSANVELQTGTVVVAGELVVVARRGVGASKDRSKFSVVEHPFAAERHRADFVGAQSQGPLGQDLKIHRAGHRSGGGDLHDQDPHGFVRKGVGRVVQHKPHRANLRVGTQFVVSIRREKCLNTWLGIVHSHLRVGRIVQLGQRSWTRQSNRRVRVVLQLRKHGEQGRCQADRIPRPIFCSVERPLGHLHHKWLRAVAEHSRHPISGLHHVDVEPVGRGVLHSHSGRGFHGQTEIRKGILRVGPSSHQHEETGGCEGLGKARELEVGHV